jgi:ATP-dependent DNA ligase
MFPSISGDDYPTGYSPWRSNYAWTRYIVCSLGSRSWEPTKIASDRFPKSGQAVERRSSGDLYAFDVLAMDGDDLRPMPLSMRKASLAKLLHWRPDGIFTGSFEQGEIGPDLFRHACLMGLEGLVSKRRDRPYRSGRSKDSIKMKNRAHPAMERVKDSLS